MEDSVPLQLIIIFILLGFSAFFSGSETAFFSINYIALQKLKKRKDRISKLVCYLLSKPNNLLITILISNMMVNIFAAAIASGIAIGISKTIGLHDYIGAAFAIVVMTIVLLFFGEITPKLIAVKRPIKFSRILSSFIFFFVIILKPLSILFQWFTDLLTKKAFKDNNALDNHDIESVIKIGHKEGLIDEDEKDMFENVFESMSKEAQDIMLPVKDMFAMDISIPQKKLVPGIISSEYDLIPVYKENDDQIIGVVRKKDLLPYYFNLKKNLNIRKLINPVIYVPEGKKIFDLLKEFQKQKLEFAIVVDEYGNVIGYITIDELIEEIVGEYKDEYDKEDIFVRKIGKRKFLVKGDMKIEDFNEEFKTNFISEEANTINGILLEKLERIPEKGEKIVLGNFIFTVSRRKGPIIDTLIMEGRDR